jgi:hypothetical protein
MHSLKPTGDNIAEEFFRLMKNKGLQKTASDAMDVSLDIDDSFDEVESEGGEVPGEDRLGELEDLVESNKYIASQEGMADWAAQLEQALTGSGDISVEGDDDDLESFFTDDNEDGLVSGLSEIDGAIDALDDMTHSASEKRVFQGLSKIASSLRSKGESFAADVVEATANSIRGDLKKDASRKSDLVSSLRKVAKELYESRDPLAGDMVQITMNKIAKAKKEA